MLIEKFISWFICALLTAAGWLLFSGCAMPPPTTYVPVSCAVETPNRPAKGKSTAESALNLVEYAKKLEFALESCK